jgi:Transposase IS116/IS110/IS902 family
VAQAPDCRPRCPHRRGRRGGSQRPAPHDPSRCRCAHRPKTTILVLGPVARFSGSKHVVSYIGLAPAVDASADTCRLGRVTKQGNALLRWVLGQATLHAIRADAQLKRRYFAILYRRGRARAKVAITRKLLVRLYVMLRDQIDYDEFCRRGQAARARKEPADSQA